MVGAPSCCPPEVADASAIDTCDSRGLLGSWHSGSRKVLLRSLKCSDFCQLDAVTRSGQALAASARCCAYVDADMPTVPGSVIEATRPEQPSFAN
jgi:hypothetical protein